jgi:hypothetical protein
MKKLALTAVFGAALLAAPTLASAQVTGSIQSTATISTVFAFGTSSDLDFGAITPGTASTASGYIRFDRNVGVIFTLPDAANTGKLTSAAGGTLQPAFTCGVGPTNAAVVTAFTSCAPATGTTAVLTQAAPTGTSTEYVIFNGSLTAAQTNTVPGTYNGVIRITATAN